MAIFRKVHTSFWSDPFIQDLTIEQRYFYLYILTNEQTKQCGIYEISKKQISFDTGYSMDKVSTLLAYFIKSGKIRYNEVTKELAVGKWLKYNNSTSPTIKSCINKEFESVKDRVLIDYVYSMDTSSQEEQEEEQEEEQKIESVEKHPLVKWIERECPEVAKMKKPLTNQEAERIVELYEKDDIKMLFNKMDNWDKLKTKVSANKTFHTWALSDLKKKEEKLATKLQSPISVPYPVN